MKRIYGLFVLATLGLHGGLALADGVECHPDARKLEWYVCVVKPVEYKRGIRTEKRDECAINQKLDVKGCDLGDVQKYLPAGEDPANTYVYAIGPASFDMKAWEIQRNNEKNGCMVGTNGIYSWQLTRFSDAFDKDNSQRGRDYEEKLRQKNLMLIPYATLSASAFPGTKCAGKKAVLGAVDKKSLSKFLYYTEVTFK